MADKQASKKSKTGPGKGKAVRPKLSVAQRRMSRRLILQALYQWLMADAEPLEIAGQFREKNQGNIDWSYFDEVFLEIPAQAAELVALFEPLLDRELKALDPIEKALLYLGTFELKNRIDIPYRVVINEAVELAKVFGATDSHKYINGILDKLSASLRQLEVKSSR